MYCEEEGYITKLDKLRDEVYQIEHKTTSSIKEERFFKIFIDELGLPSLVDLIVNYGHHPILPCLIYHNILYFQSTKFLSSLNLILKFRCNITGAGLKSCERKRYIFDLNCISKEVNYYKLWVKSDRLYKPSYLVYDSVKYFGLTISYNLNKFYSFDISEEPFASQNDSIFDEIIVSYVESTSDSSDSTISLGDDDLLPPTNTLFIPDNVFTDIDESRLKHIKSELIKLDPDSILYEEEKCIIAEFDYIDVNRLNRVYFKGKFISETMLGDPGGYKSMDWFKFLTNIHIFDDSSIKEMNESFGFSARYLSRRFQEMDEVTLNPTATPPEIKEIHLSKMAEMDLINEEAKEVYLNWLNRRINDKEKDRSLHTLYAKKCLIMSSIRAMYTKYCYIPDQLLCRITPIDHQKSKFNIEDFVNTVYYRVRFLKSIEDGTYKSGISPSDNEIREKGRDYYTESEKAVVIESLRKNESETWEYSYNYYCDYLSKEFVDGFIMNFTFEPAKLLIPYLVDLKNEYNCMIKNKKNWTEEDNEHFLMVMQTIFSIDPDFIKYLPQNKRVEAKGFLNKLQRTVKNCVTTCSFYNPAEMEYLESEQAAYLENVLNKQVPRLKLNSIKDLSKVSVKNWVNRVYNEKHQQWEEYINDWSIEVRSEKASRYHNRYKNKGNNYCTVKSRAYKRFMDEKGYILDNDVADRIRPKNDKERLERMWLLNPERYKDKTIDCINEMVEAMAPFYSTFKDTIDLTPKSLGLMEGRTKGFKAWPNKEIDCNDVYNNIKVKTYSEVVKNSTQIYKNADSLRKFTVEKKELLDKKRNNINAIFHTPDKKINLENTLKPKNVSWFKPKVFHKPKRETDVQGVETKNRFSVLYSDEKVVKEANLFTKHLLKTDKGLCFIFDREKYKNKFKQRSDYLNVVENSGLPKEKMVSKYDRANNKKSWGFYKCVNLYKLIVEILLCHHYNVYYDCSYFKRIYGIKRCQIKYMARKMYFLKKELIKRYTGVTKA